MLYKDFNIIYLSSRRNFNNELLVMKNKSKLYELDFVLFKNNNKYYYGTIILIHDENNYEIESKEGEMFLVTYNDIKKLYES
jgi:hypothetical protein